MERNYLLMALVALPILYFATKKPETFPVATNMTDAQPTTVAAKIATRSNDTPGLAVQTAPSQLSGAIAGVGIVPEQNGYLLPTLDERNF